MIKLIFQTLLLSLIASNCIAGTKLVKHDSIRALPFNYICKVALLNLADPLDQRVQVEFEKSIHKKIAMQFGVAYFLIKDKKYFTPNDYFNTPFFEIQNAKYKLLAEVKYYNNIKQKKKFTTLNNIAINITYGHKYYFQPNKFYSENNQPHIYIDTIWAKRQTVAFTMVRGHSIIYHHLFFEVVYGLGYMYYNLKFDNKRFQNSKTANFFNLTDYKEQKLWHMNMLLNIKIGYSF